MIPLSTPTGSRAGFGHVLTLATATLMLGACAVAPTAPGKPSIASSMPGAWAEQTGKDAPSVITAPEWWRHFGSDELSRLIAVAQGANPDLVIAAERVRQAEVQVRIAGASLFPNLGLAAGTSLRETRPDGAARSTSEATSLGLNAGYELDLWGRNAAGVRVTESSLLASRYDLETVRLTLVTGVANAWFQILSLRGRLAVARENLQIAERVLAVVEIRVRNGVASALDLARQRTAVLGQRASLPVLELQERQTLHALALLLGTAPGAFDPGINSDNGGGALRLGALTVPHIAPGLPADLLVRRPDLAAAEAQLAGAHANVAVARAALLPRIQLTGSTGLASSVLLDLLSAPTLTLAIGASLAQSIFDGGVLRGQVELAQSRERELIENYRKAILVALSDVEGALAAGSRTALQEALQQQVLEQAREALRLAEIRYREGVDDLLTVQ